MWPQTPNGWRRDSQLCLTLETELLGVGQLLGQGTQSTLVTRVLFSSGQFKVSDDGHL